MTLDEMKDIIKRQAEAEEGETAEGEVTVAEEDAETYDYLQALYHLEDSADLFDEIIDNLDHRIPIGLAQRLEMKRLANEIRNYLVETDLDDDTDDDDDEESEV